MKNELQLFTNEIFGEVQAIKINEKVWFAGEGTVKALGYNLETNSYTKYIKRYVKEKYQLKVDSKTQFQNGLDFDYKELGQRGGYLINEYGVIQLVMNSPLPQAEEFQDWIIEEVIPSVLSTGEYSIKPQPKSERELAQESMYDLIMGNLSTEENRAEALQLVVRHTKMVGKSEVCNDGTITIPGVKKIVIKHYADIFKEYNIFLSDQFVEFHRFLSYMQYLEGKLFKRKSGVGLEKKATYQPTPLFHDNFVAQGFAQVRVIDDRGKVEITYTKDIEKYIVSESFKNEFFKYLGVDLTKEIKEIA